MQNIQSLHDVITEVRTYGKNTVLLTLSVCHQLELHIAVWARKLFLTSKQQTQTDRLLTYVKKRAPRIYEKKIVISMGTCCKFCWFLFSYIMNVSTFSGMCILLVALHSWIQSASHTILKNYAFREVRTCHYTIICKPQAPLRKPEISHNITRANISHQYPSNICSYTVTPFRVKEF
jgi:hypothetical protein